MTSITDISQWVVEHPWKTAGILAVTYETYRLAKSLWIDPYLSPLSALPGPPKADNWLLGNIPTIYAQKPARAFEKWFEEYNSHTVVYRGGFSEQILITKDLAAISHILGKNYDFPKPWGMRQATGRVFGKGLLYAEADDHRRQRKMMSGSYVPSAVRDIMPIFYDKGYLLRDKWVQQIDEAGGIVNTDVLLGLSRATLDIIGLAGFDYNFDTLNQGESNELCKAFMGLFAPIKASASHYPLLDFLQNYYPILAKIPTEKMIQQRDGKRVMDRVGAELVAAKKAEIRAAQVGDGPLDKKALAGKDLLSILVRSNMAADVPESERLTDAELIDQISTMLIAGHETTSASLAWLFNDLAKPEYAHIQAKLREECLSVNTEHPSMEALNALPYLDAVVRENTRLNAVVEKVMRSAVKDLVIPVSKPYPGQDGKMRNNILIKKDQLIAVPLLLVNRDKEIWGEDAKVFNPDRWLTDSAKRAADVPGVYSSLMTFIGGPRTCIGWRMAVMEMKALIFCLVRSVEFGVAPTTKDVKQQSHIVIRPYINQEDGSIKSCLPLTIKAAH